MPFSYLPLPPPGEKNRTNRRTNIKYNLVNVHVFFNVVYINVLCLGVLTFMHGIF